MSLSLSELRSLYAKQERVCCGWQKLAGQKYTVSDRVHYIWGSGTEIFISSYSLIPVFGFLCSLCIYVRVSGAYIVGALLL